MLHQTVKDISRRAVIWKVGLFIMIHCPVEVVLASMTWEARFLNIPVH